MPSPHFARPRVPDAPDRTVPRPLDPPMVPVTLGGMAAWAIVGLVLLVFFREWLAGNGHTNWLWICLAGFLLGVPGLLVMRRHDANRRARRATTERPTP